MSGPLHSPSPARLDTLLERTSRTFALSIPRLPEPTRREVTVAYLLFRIADTLEDATLWPPERRADELMRLAATLEQTTGHPAPENLATEWLASPPLEHREYLELLGETAAVFEAVSALSPAANAAIRHHIVRTIERMAEFLRAPVGDAADGLERLRAYCYAVAGIVGELLTELFVLEAPQLSSAAPYLRERAALFGEALQLVNILRDSAADADEGRSYLPPSAGRGPVFELARRDLRSAREYVLRLQHSEAPRGVIEFTALPVLLASRTLDLVERDGPGAKLGRPTVIAIVARLSRNLDRGRPAVPE